MAQKININNTPPAPKGDGANPLNVATGSVINNGPGVVTRYLPDPALQTAANIGVGKLLQNAPDPVSSAVNFAINPSPGQIIKEFLLVPTVGPNLMPEYDGNTLNGDPIYANLEIRGTSWTDMTTGATKSFPDLAFNTVLLSVQQNKNIIETPIQGSDSGAILEYVGLSNYNITINLIIPGTNGMYPQGDMENVKNMLTCPTELHVGCWYLNTFDIYSIIIRSYVINQERGGISQQAITIQAQSTNAVTLIIQ